MAYHPPVRVFQAQDQDACRTHRDTSDRDITDLAMLDDTDLLALIVYGESAALGVLYDRYHRLVFTIALRITDDQGTAEEVIQNVFYDVWRTASGFQHTKGPVLGWLMGITRHRAIDATRSRYYRSRQCEDDLPCDYPNDAKSEPEQQTDVLFLREAVRTALNALPPAQRQAIELAFYSGMTRAEIAEYLGAPLGTVKTRMRLGMQRLQALLMSMGMP